MAKHPIDKSSGERAALSRDRVLRCAVELADEAGIDSLTIRSLARALGTKPMSLYHYVANKSEILDGIVDIVFSEIEMPSATGNWRSEMHRRANSARRVLSRHKWAIGLLESRTTPGPATLRHHEATLASLRRAGFSVQMTAHAYALLDSYIYGFALQEAALPLTRPGAAAAVVNPLLELFAAGDYPHLMEIATEHVMQPGYDFGDEFEIGLNAILDGLAGSLPEIGGELPAATSIH